MVSIIISTYNQPEWLEKVLWGYEMQTYKDFEILIADDGSNDETKELIQRFQKESNLKIEHIWHPDSGFQKSTILNKAILHSNSEYLIFSDGDCIPRPDFVKTHVKLSEPNYFLSGGYCKLPMKLSKMICREEIKTGVVFSHNWLVRGGLRQFSSRCKLLLSSPWNTIMDCVTPTKSTWNGCNASTWKSNLIKVNGHNESMQYGGQDREMGERLIYAGLKSKQIRNRAILLHLDHSRGYATQEVIEKSRAIRAETSHRKLTWTENGIIKQVSRG